MVVADVTEPFVILAFVVASLGELDVFSVIVGYVEVSGVVFLPVVFSSPV